MGPTELPRVMSSKKYYKPNQTKDSGAFFPQGPQIYSVIQVCWLFNEEKLTFADVLVEDTADLCRITIPSVRAYHYGTYTVLAENEVGRAITSATLLPFYSGY